jgi:hypothetical protein
MAVTREKQNTTPQGAITQSVTQNKRNNDKPPAEKQPAVKAPAVEAPPETVTATGTAIAPNVPSSAAVSNAVPEQTTATPLAAVDGPDNSAPIEVPAAPVEPTATEIAGIGYNDKLQALLLAWFSERPQIDWHEPTMQEKNDLVMALANTKYSGDIIAAVAEVQAKIEADRRAAGFDQQNARDIEYLREAHKHTIGLASTIEGMIEKLGGKIKKSTSSAGATTRAVASPRSSWVELNPRLIAWAKKHNLRYFALVDQTDGGYKGEYHAVIACADGRWQRAHYNPTTHEITPIDGAFETRPIYFNNPDDGEKPKWPIEAMFGVLLVTGDGKILNLPSKSIERKGKLTPLGSWQAIRDDAQGK